MEKSKLRSFTIKTKLAAVDYSKTHSIENTAKVFQVETKRIREWRAAAEELEKQYKSGKTTIKRLKGGGRKIRSEEFESKLNDWIIRVQSRENRLRVSRKMIQRQALEWSTDSEFQASNGWLQKFMLRNGFVLRRRTTIAQKTPSNCTEKIINFICYLRHRRTSGQYDNDAIFVMDETPVWIEPVANTTINLSGAKEIPIKSTGAENVRITVILTARGDGAKMNPYIVIPRKRPIKEVDQVKNIENVLIRAEVGWTMN